MHFSKSFLLALAAISTLSLAQNQVESSTAAAKSADYKRSIVSKGAVKISDENKSLIAANILCQNVPEVGDDNVAAMEEYSLYITKVSDLFANNAKDIENHIIGINQDSQISYTLIEPVSIVGIDFDVVNVNRLKDVGGNYYQLSAEKPLNNEDMSKIKNIPVEDNLTVSTKNKHLSVICNIKLRLSK